MTGLFNELGPLRFVDDVHLQLEDNPFSWDLHANLLFIDQPIGTGLSYAHDDSSLVTDESQMAKHLREGILSFLALHPEYRAVECYITGEYAPSSPPPLPLPQH